MTSMQAAVLYAGLFCLLMLLLKANVGRVRTKHKVGFGDGGNEAMQRSLRVQGNAVEDVPVVLLGLIGLEIRVGIMVDVSHAAKSTMLQAVAVSKAPVIASHSGARAVNDHSRNLDDEQLRAIRDSGGVVQCVALASFLKSNADRSAALNVLKEEVGLSGPASEGISDDERNARWEAFQSRSPEVDARFPPADVAVYCDHIDHIVQIAGIDHAGIGSDFDGGGGIGGWQNASQSRNVTRELVRRGYTEADIQKIWSGNLLRVWRAAEAVSTDW